MSNNKNNMPLFGATRFLFPIFVLLIGALTLIQCKKETPLADEQKIEQRQTSERELFSVTKPWLIQFQNDLNAVIADNNATVTIYTPDQMAAGVESLINLFVGRPPAERGAHITKTNSFTVDLSGNNTSLRSLYGQAYQKYLDQKAAVDATAKPLSVSVSIDSVKNTIAYVSTRTIFTWDCACFKERFTVSNVAPCASAFSNDEGFFVGGGDEDGVITASSLYINPMCDEGCGNIAPCTAGPTYDGSDPLNPSDPLNCIYCQLY